MQGTRGILFCFLIDDQNKLPKLHHAKYYIDFFFSLSILCKASPNYPFIYSQEMFLICSLMKMWRAKLQESEESEKKSLTWA